ncbi:hypothetical protein BGZ98_006423, partial [Dissophora globulifera]
MYDTGMAGQSQFLSFCIFFGSVVLGFLVEAWPRHTSLQQQQQQQRVIDGSQEQGGADTTTMLTAYDRSNLFSRLSFHFMQDLFSKSFHGPLQESDISNIMPQRIQTQYSLASLGTLWHEHVRK